MQLITGTSSGLGFGLAEFALQQGEVVAGISRRPCPLASNYPHHYFHMELDLADTQHLAANLRRQCHLLRDWLQQEQGISQFPLTLDKVWLNAGVLGRIDDLQNSTLPELKDVMEVNLWANKIVIDTIASPDCPFRPKAIIAISSGASVNGSRGWAGYSISKAALNMLVKLYSQELPEIHCIALAPGLIDTAMQETISGIEDTDTFPALKRLQQARGTGDMPMPREAAKRIFDSMDLILSQPSGSFVDIRKL